MPQIPALPRPCLAAVAAAALLAAHPAARAATQVWDGNGDGRHFSFVDAVTGNTNWQAKSPDGLPLPRNGDALQFTGPSSAVVNDLPGLALRSLLFDAQAGSFALSGQALQLSHGIDNRSGQLQQVLLHLSATADQTWASRAGDQLLIAGGFDPGGHALRLLGDVHVQGAGQDRRIEGGARISLLEGSGWSALGELRVAQGSALTHEGAVLQLRSGVVESGGSFAWNAGRIQIDQAELRAVFQNQDSPLLGQQLTLTGMARELQVDSRLDIGRSAVLQLEQGNRTRVDGLTTLTGQLGLAGSGTRFDTGVLLLSPRDGEGSGSVRVQQGAQLHVVGALVVAQNHSASLQLDSGALGSAELLIVGQRAERTGSLVLDGAGTRFAVSDGLFIGEGGRATALVSNGAELLAERAELARNGPGSLELRGTGSRLAVAAALNAGSGASLLAGAGTRIETGSARLGGTARLDGATWLAGSALQLDGRLELGGAGNLLQVDGALQLGAAAQMTLADGVLRVASARRQEGARFDWTGGRLEAGSLGYGREGLLNGFTLTAGHDLQLGGVLSGGSGGRLDVRDTVLRAAGIEGGGVLDVRGLASRVEVTDAVRLAGSGAGERAELRLELARLQATTVDVGPHAALLLVNQAVVEADAVQVRADGLLDLHFGSRVRTPLLRVEAGGHVHARREAQPEAKIIELAGQWQLETGASLSLRAGQAVRLQGGSVEGGTLQLRSDTLLAGHGRLAGGVTFLGGQAQSEGGELVVDGDVRGLPSFGGEAVRLTGRLDAGFGSSRFGGADVRFDPGSVLRLDLRGAGEHERLVDVGAMSFAGVIELVVDPALALLPGQRFQLVDMQRWDGGFAPAQLRVIGSSFGFDTTQLTLDGSVTAVPEPAAALLFGLGLLGLGAARARRQASAAQRAAQP